MSLRKHLISLATLPSARGRTSQSTYTCSICMPVTVLPSTEYVMHRLQAKVHSTRAHDSGLVDPMECLQSQESHEIIYTFHSMNKHFTTKELQILQPSPSNRLDGAAQCFHISKVAGNIPSRTKIRLVDHLCSQLLSEAPKNCSKLAAQKVLAATRSCLFGEM